MHKLDRLGGLALASIEAGADLISGRILDDPITLPGPEPAPPDARLVAPWLESLRRLRVDISESGLVSVASGRENGELEPLVELQPAAELGSGFWVPSFETSLELSPTGLRASLAHEGETTLSASGYALLPWQVSLARHSWFNLDLNGDRLRFEPGLEVVPQIVWGGLRLQTAGLRSEWVGEEACRSAARRIASESATRWPAPYPRSRSAVSSESKSPIWRSSSNRPLEAACWGEAASAKVRR